MTLAPDAAVDPGTWPVVGLAETAELIATGRLTAVAALQRALARIDVAQPVLGAFRVGAQ